MAEVQRTDKTGKDNGKELNKKDMEFLLKISDNTKTFVAEVFDMDQIEAFECINSGADEVDMVLAVGKLKSKDFTYVLNDIRYVTRSVFYRHLTTWTVRLPMNVCQQLYCDWLKFCKVVYR